MSASTGRGFTDAELAEATVKHDRRMALQEKREQLFKLLQAQVQQRGDVGVTQAAGPWQRRLIIKGFVALVDDAWEAADAAWRDEVRRELAPPPDPPVDANPPSRLGSKP